MVTGQVIELEYRLFMTSLDSPFGFDCERRCSVRTTPAPSLNCLEIFSFPSLVYFYVSVHTTSWLQTESGSFYMIGAFGAALLAEITGSFFIGLISSFIVAMFAGVITEILVIRKLYKKDHLDQVLATFALILIFSEGIRWIFGAYPLYLNIPSELNASVYLPLEIIFCLEVS